MRANRIWVAAALMTVVVLAGCTKDKSDDPDTFTRQDLIDQLTTSVGLPQQQAECIADGVEDEGIPLEELRDAVLGNLAPGDAISAEDQQKVSTILGTCITDPVPPGSTP
jgi:hypothetical protein